MFKYNHFIRGAIITVLLIVLNQGLIQFWLYQKRQDARLINVAGRQRMLSQRISLEFHRNLDKQNDTLIRDLYHQWTTAHYAFLNSNDSLDVSVVSESETLALLNRLSANVHFIEPFLDANPITKRDLDNIYRNQASFLQDMEAVVGLLEENSVFKLRIIIFGEILLAILSVTILLLEIRYIYQPIAKKQADLVKSQESKLENQEKKLSQIAWEQSHLVRSPVASLSGLTYMFMHEADNLTEDDKRQIMHFIEIETGRLNEIVSETVRLTNGDEPL
ncbi:MAG: type IV pili methyl-accepting chemotaxis transducer N-terminal domain-containing protein [Bacteroidota bacterium]